MAKQQPRDNYERSDGGLWLPRGGIVGPNRKRPKSRRFMPGYPCCCANNTVNCESCFGNKAPPELLVTLSGITANPEYYCGAKCLIWNDDWVLPYCSGYQCRWALKIGEITCSGFISAHITARAAETETWFLSVVFHRNSTAACQCVKQWSIGQAVFEIGFDGIPNCLAFDNLELPKVPDPEVVSDNYCFGSYNPADIFCIVSSATCHVTSL